MTLLNVYNGTTRRWYRMTIRPEDKMTNLEKVRRKKGLTQVDLEKKSGVPHKTIREYEQGRNNINNAKAYIVVSLSEALEVPVREIMN